MNIQIAAWESLPQATKREVAKLFENSSTEVKNTLIELFGRYNIESINTPKTWEALGIKENLVRGCVVSTSGMDDWTQESSWEEVAAQAFLKIYTLIDKCYGGYPTILERVGTTNLYGIYYDPEDELFYVDDCICLDNIIVFHTKEQAEEFLVYASNVELLREFYMFK